MSPAALAAALPPTARQALALARVFDPQCDAAAAWLAAHDRPHATPDALARIIRATTRRERRTGGAHGPARLYSLPDGPEVGVDLDPCAMLEAVQALAARSGLAAKMDEREQASDPRAIARRDGITLRRAQQVLRLRRDLESSGQEVLI